MIFHCLSSSLLSFPLQPSRCHISTSTYLKHLQSPIFTAHFGHSFIVTTNFGVPNKHWWFSGKIGRCHLRSSRPRMSASPGFDSRPMHFCLPLTLSIRRESMGKLFGLVGLFGGEQGKEQRGGNNQARWRDLVLKAGCNGRGSELSEVVWRADDEPRRRRRISPFLDGSLMALRTGLEPMCGR